MSAATPLIVGVPSKGRLQEHAAQFFSRAGLQVVQSRGARDYRGTFAGMDGVELVFLSAAEIVGQLAAGAIHLGITGEDLVREALADADQRIELLAKLDFGQANVVVAVPQAWIDVRSMADLEDVALAFRARHARPMRVATKYVRLTRAHFASHHVADYRIVESLGATEGAPAGGQAELIVDITTTGTTLAANALKVLDDGIILRSQANLAASLGAVWDATCLTRVKTILARIGAEAAARAKREVRARFAERPANLLVAATELFEVQPLFDGPGQATLALTIAAARANELAEWLILQGAETAAVSRFDYLFAAENALFDRLHKRLRPPSAAPLPADPY
jgi:ATP phosphoribosyltransferase